MNASSELYKQIVRLLAELLKTFSTFHAIACHSSFEVQDSPKRYSEEYKPYAITSSPSTW